MSNFALIVIILGALALGAGFTFAYRRGKDPVEDEMNYEKRARELFAQQERAARRNEQQQDQADEQAQRLDQLLSKWEEQTRRQDAILERLEKQHEIKK